uniref:WAP domain-containing protein n=1 Tax=Vombatus ursinus TaxID=29139 RepID=A0A4X2LFN6_VOMUR
LSLSFFVLSLTLLQLSTLFPRMPVFLLAIIYNTAYFSPFGSSLTLGACVELCGGDWDCEPEERCVSNGCGHVCTDQSV